ncbi:MAG: rhodanese-like domain-containing protein [Acidimicrobiales bacterium]
MPDIPEIDVTQLAVRRREGAALVDVREPSEFAAGRVPGGQLIPLGEVAARVAEVPRDGTVYVICAGGGRSAKAVEHLRAQGIDAVNVAGGTRSWIEAGFPIDADPESGLGHA